MPKERRARLFYILIAAMVGLYLLALLPPSSLIALSILVAIFGFAWRMGKRQTGQNGRIEDQVDVQRRAQEVAQRALRRAGYDPEALPVDLLDIGFLIYRGGTKPSGVVRDEAIRTDVTHIRPYLRLDYPLRQIGQELIRFELLDAAGSVHYKDEAWYDLQPGDNFLTPKTWLPLYHQALDGRWMLRVTAGETPFAVHVLRWKQVRKSEFRAALDSDGEIDDEVQATIDQSASKPLSLDELLSDQTPAQTTARRR